MQRAKIRLINLILTIIVSLFGMNFECRDTDSSFARVGMEVSCEVSDSSLKPVQTKIADAQVCTAEMSGVKSTGSIRQGTGRYVRPNREVKLFPDVLCSNHPSLQVFHFNSSFRITLLPGKSPDELVTIYIHNSDGKKRI